MQHNLKVELSESQMCLSEMIHIFIWTCFSSFSFTLSSSGSFINHSDPLSTDHLFYFPVPSQIQDESGFIVFLQYATSSHFTRMLSPSVCDFSVASLLDLPPGKGIHCLPLLCWSFLLLTFSQLVRVQSAIFTEKSLCPRYGLDNSSLELRDELSKRHSCLLEAYSLGVLFCFVFK